MRLRAGLIKAAAYSVVALLPLAAATAQNKTENSADVKRVMWEQVDIASRDLYFGPGGREMQPVLEKSQYLGRQPGGNNLKHRIKDGSGREWVAKIADESQPEAAAVRLLWGIGYKTEINYIVPKLEIAKVGNYRNVRFEARPDNVKRLDRWSWTSNPFAGTNEFEGLKVMMAMFNNWDLKDENNVVIQEGDKHYFIIADLGASFGKLADWSDNPRSGRSVNQPEQFAQSNFIRRVDNGVIEFDYRGKADFLIKGIKVEHGRWVADLLLQLSDKQIEDAFRAANYKDEEIKILAQAFKSRIRELDLATKPAAETAQNE
jgi:hypothetical protein